MYMILSFIDNLGEKIHICRVTAICLSAKYILIPEV